MTQINMQCWNCGEFYSVQLNECDRCGQPWNGFLPEPTGTGPCLFCGTDTPYYDDPDDPIVCSDCIHRLVNGEWLEPFEQSNEVQA